MGVHRQQGLEYGLSEAHVLVTPQPPPHRQPYGRKIPKTQPTPTRTRIMRKNHIQVRHAARQLPRTRTQTSCRLPITATPIPNPNFHLAPTPLQPHRTFSPPSQKHHNASCQIPPQPHTPVPRLAWLFICFTSEIPEQQHFLCYTNPPSLCALSQPPPSLPTQRSKQPNSTWTLPLRCTPSLDLAFCPTSTLSTSLPRPCGPVPSWTTSVHGNMMS